MIHILKELEDMAINNRLGLERFFRLDCLKPLLRMFDFEEGLKVFPSQDPRSMCPRRVVLPDSALSKPSIYDNRKGKKKEEFQIKKLGCEKILSDAKRILLKNRKLQSQRDNSN